MKKIVCTIILALVVASAAAASTSNLRITTTQMAAFRHGLVSNGSTHTKCELLVHQTTIACVFQVGSPSPWFGVAVTRPRTCTLHARVFLITDKARTIKTLNYNLCA